MKFSRCTYLTSAPPPFNSWIRPCIAPANALLERTRSRHIRGEEASTRLGGRELMLLCARGFHQHTLLQNKDSSGLLGTLVYNLKLGGGGGVMPPPMLKLGGGGGLPPLPPCGAPPAHDRFSRRTSITVPYSRVIRRISPISAYPLLGGGFCS